MPKYAQELGIQKSCKARGSELRGNERTCVWSVCMYMCVCVCVCCGGGGGGLSVDVEEKSV